MTSIPRLPRLLRIWSPIEDVTPCANRDPALAQETATTTTPWSDTPPNGVACRNTTVVHPGANPHDEHGRGPP